VLEPRCRTLKRAVTGGNSTAGSKWKGVKNPSNMDAKPKEGKRWGSVKMEKDDKVKGVHLGKNTERLAAVWKVRVS